MHRRPEVRFGSQVRRDDMTTYWKASGELSKKILAQIDIGSAAIHEAYFIAKEVGAWQVYSSSGFFGTSIDGFTFRKPEEVPRGWTRIKGTEDGWRPRANSEIGKRLAALETKHVGAIRDMIGMKFLGPGMEVRSPGVRFGAGMQAYVAVPDDVTPKNCTRVSDLEWERISGNKSSKRKAKKSSS